MSVYQRRGKGWAVSGVHCIVLELDRKLPAKRCPAPDVSLSPKDRAALKFSSGDHQMSFCCSHISYVWHMRERRFGWGFQRPGATELMGGYISSTPFSFVMWNKGVGLEILKDLIMMFYKRVMRKCLFNFSLFLIASALFAIINWRNPTLLSILCYLLRHVCY